MSGSVGVEVRVSVRVEVRVSGSVGVEVRVAVLLRYILFTCCVSPHDVAPPALSLPC